MKNIKNFQNFINEDFLNIGVLKKFGDIILSKKDSVDPDYSSTSSYNRSGDVDKNVTPINNTNPKKILFIGDSHTSIKTKDGKAVTYTFPNILKKELEPEGYTIDVLALGGMTTQWMLDNLPKQLSGKKYDRVYIYGGANDAMNSSIKLEKALENIQKMVDLSRENGADVFVNQGYIIEGKLVVSVTGKKCLSQELSLKNKRNGFPMWKE